MPLVYDTDENWNYGRAVCCLKKKMTEFRPKAEFRREVFCTPPPPHTHCDFVLLLIFCDSHSCTQLLCVLGSKLSALICILEIILLVFFRGGD